MNDGPSRAEFTAAWDRIERQLVEGFRGVNVRLDAMNGRVTDGEVELGRHDQRLTNVEHEVFPRRRRDDPADEDHAAERARERRAENKRNALLASLGLGAAYAAFKVLGLLGGIMLELGKALVGKGAP